MSKAKDQSELRAVIEHLLGQRPPTHLYDNEADGDVMGGFQHFVAHMTVICIPPTVTLHTRCTFHTHTHRDGCSCTALGGDVRLTS
jgi:hypothetical protein